jgi:hypothetical protein
MVRKSEDTEAKCLRMDQDQGLQGFSSVIATESGWFHSEFRFVFEILPLLVDERPKCILLGIGLPF